MIFQNNRDWLKTKFDRGLVYFGGGGKSSGSNYDVAYNARMASIAEAQQRMAEKSFSFWETDYKPMEAEQIKANREMIPLEVDLKKDEIGLAKDKIAAERYDFQIGSAMCSRLFRHQPREDKTRCLQTSWHSKIHPLF